MADTNDSRKRPLAQATQGESEGGRLRQPSRRQQQLNDDQASRLQATIERQKKELVKQRQKIAAYEELNGGEEENDIPDVESQDEVDMGHGARPGGGFTSVISSKGTVQHGRSAVQKKRLVPETDPFQDEDQTSQPISPIDVNFSNDPAGSDEDDQLNQDKDTAPPPPSTQRTSLSRQSSPQSVHSRVQSAHTSRGTTPSSSSSHRPDRVSQSTTPSSLRSRFRQSERRTTPPSSLSRIRSDHTNRDSGDTPSSFSYRGSQSERTTPSPHPGSSEYSLAPPRKRAKLLPAPFREGSIPGPKPKAMDYQEGIEKMLLNAMHEYACLILAVDAFPDEVTQTRWAKTTWQAACEEVGEHYECSPRMIRLITGRGSWARSFLKDAARNNFKGFKFKEGLTDEVKRFNQDLRHTLLRDDAFHHKNQDDVTGFGEHRIVIAILQDALFEDNKSYGVKYSRHFNPVSINLLALVFTMIEFLINEWSTGERKKATFRSRNHVDTFEAHRLRTEQWCELDPVVTENIRKRMFKTLMKKAGASEQVEGARVAVGMTDSMKERAKEALAGRTGETDDEDD